jgi:hypothetical protein
VLEVIALKFAHDRAIHDSVGGRRAFLIADVLSHVWSL